MQLPPFKQPASGDRVGSYRLLKQLGDGGQGLVFKAECAGRFFVLKFFRARELDAWGLTEVSLLQKFSHPHIVRVLGYGRWPDPELGCFYIAMEWVEGVTLEQYALEENPSARTCARLMRTLASTLAAVHRKRVLHRDVKRDNILIRARDGQPVLVDFGIGNATEATPGPGSGLLPPGTQEYVSPEAWRFLGENVGEPVSYTSRVSDELWALGVTFYWLLTQRLPFGTRRNPFMVKAILGVIPLAPSECNPRVPRALSDVCMRMLEKDPAARFEDMTALDEALEAALAGAQGEASWDVPLGDPDAPHETTTDELPGQEVWDEEERAVRRCAAPPRRGRQRPSAEEGPTPVVPPPCLPEVGESPAPVAEALAVRMAALFPDRAWEDAPRPRGEGAAAPRPAVKGPATPGPAPLLEERAVPPREAAPPRGLWQRATSRALPTFVGGVPVRGLALGALLRAAWALALVAAGGGLAMGVASFRLRGEVHPPVLSSPTEPWSGTPTLQPALAGEVAVVWESSQAGGGAALSLSPIPASGFTSAMLRKEEPSVNPHEKPPSPVRRIRWTEKCITAACCAALGGCTGSTPQVRPAAPVLAPKPEACPPNALKAMKELEIGIGQEGRVEFHILPADSGLMTVTESSPLVLIRAVGKLETNTVLSGHLLFWEGRVYGRFTQARRPEWLGGQTYPVCFELRYRNGGLGVDRDDDGHSTDSAVISSLQDVRAVDRFDVVEPPPSPGW